MTDQDRRELGAATARAVYGELATLPEGHVYGDALLEQLFAEVWARPNLDIPRRRLLVMGVLAAQGRFEPLGLQFRRCLATGELTPEELDEVVLHLTHYVGWGMSQPLVTEAETAKAEHAAGEAAT
jgi:alkylhydroperoxidase/carboxymuconolactone decarboxylase family protein YurZ